MPGIVLNRAEDRPYGPGNPDYIYDQWRQERDETMSVIWKFQLEVTSHQTVEMPKGAHIIHVASQFEKPCLWAIVDPMAEKEARPIGILTTGQTSFGAREIKYLGSFMLQGGAFVWHVVEPVEG